MSVSFISVLFCFKGGLKLTYFPPPHSGSTYWYYAFFVVYIGHLILRKVNIVTTYANVLSTANF